MEGPYNIIHVTALGEQSVDFAKIGIINNLLYPSSCYSSRFRNNLDLVCSKLRPNGYLFFGKTIIMSDEKDWTLGFEPVAQFLPSARFKSGNNLVQ